MGSPFKITQDKANWQKRMDKKYGSLKSKRTDKFGNVIDMGEKSSISAEEAGENYMKMMENTNKNRKIK